MQLTHGKSNGIESCVMATTAAFIDNSSLYKASVTVKRGRIEYAALKDWLEKHYGPDLKNIVIYISAPPDGKADSLIRYLRQLGFMVKTQTLEQKRLTINCPVCNEKIEGPSVDRFSQYLHVPMTVDIMTQANDLRTLILFAHDPTFLPLIHVLRSRGILVDLVSHPAMTSPELVDNVDSFLPLQRIPGIFGGEPRRGSFAHEPLEVAAS